MYRLSFYFLIRPSQAYSRMRILLRSLRKSIQLYLGGEKFFFLLSCLYFIPYLILDYCLLSFLFHLVEECVSNFFRFLIVLILLHYLLRLLLFRLELVVLFFIQIFRWDLLLEQIYFFLIFPLRVWYLIGLLQVVRFSQLFDCFWILINVPILHFCFH